MSSSIQLDQTNEIRVLEAFERLCNGVHDAGQGIHQAGSAVAGPISLACILGGIGIFLGGASWFLWSIRHRRLMEMD